MSDKSKPVSRAELAAHIQSGKATEWLSNIEQTRSALIDAKGSLAVLWPGNTCDEIVEIARLRDLLVSGEPLRSVDRGNIAQLLHRAIHARLKKTAGASARSVRDPFVALDYALRKWVTGDARAAKADVARRWGMKPANVARIWTDHDKAAEKGLREMRAAVRKSGGTLEAQVAAMLKLAKAWPELVKQRERLLDEVSPIFVPGINLQKLLSRF